MGAGAHTLSSNKDVAWPEEQAEPSGSDVESPETRHQAWIFISQKFEGLYRGFIRGLMTLTSVIVGIATFRSARANWRAIACFARLWL
jgi:hypothetical protein